MNIESVESRHFDIPFLGTYRNALVVTPCNRYVHTTIRAGEFEGLGEVSPMPGYSAETQESIVAAINVWIGPKLRGIDIFDTSAIDEIVTRTLPDNWYAKACVDLALWDLRAKARGMPLVELIGGRVHKEIPIAAVVPLAEPATMAETARTWKQRGATFLQCKISHNRKDSVARIAAIRDAIGDDVAIAVDGNASFERNEALRTAEAIGKFRIDYFEQPLRRDDYRGLAMLVRSAPMMIVVDESLHCAADAMRLCDMQAVGGFNIKLSKSGITESRKIMAIADAAGIPFGLGTMFESRRGTRTAVQFAASLPRTYGPAELIGPWFVDDRDTDTELELSKDRLAWIVPGSGANARP